MPIKRVHLFTIIQLACLIILWLIKSFSQTSILFPLMLVVMIGIRKSLDCVFTRRELKILDDIMPEMSKRAAADDLHQLDAEVGFRQKYLPAFLGGRGKRQPKGAGLDIGFGGVGGGVGSVGGANDFALLKCNTSNANEKEFEAQSSLLKK